MAVGFGCAADRGFLDDPANLFQPASRLVRVWRGRPRPRLPLTQRVRLRDSLPMIFMAVGMLMRVGVLALLLPELLAWQILLAVGVDIHLGRRNPSAHHTRDLQPRAHIERRDRSLEQFRRHTGVHQCAKEHVAADAGKTVKIGDAHRFRFLTTEDTEITEAKSVRIGSSVSSVAAVVKLFRVHE